MAIIRFANPSKSTCTVTGPRGPRGGGGPPAPASPSPPPPPPPPAPAGGSQAPGAGRALPVPRHDLHHFPAATDSDPFSSTPPYTTQTSFRDRRKSCPAIAIANRNR